MGKQLSAHFSEEEFRCHCCGRLPAGGVSRSLVLVLEKMRAEFYPEGLKIISGYRCPAQNRAGGGAPNSQHLAKGGSPLMAGKGELLAADIPPRITEEQARSVGVRGTGVDHSTGHVSHVDLGPVRSWEYADR